MSKHHINIDDETMTVLKRSDISPTSVKLPPGQLPRPLYMKVNKVLETAGGKWNRSQQAHIFTSDPREALGMAITNGEIKDHKKASQAFYTPPEIAKIVVMHASVEGKDVLEPSAGHGAIADAAKAAGAWRIDCIDADEPSARILTNKGYMTLHADFMEQKAGLDEYDRVVMNPPFENGKDIAHVTHAFGFLKRGGRLVAIMSPSWITKQDKKSAAFRQLLHEFGRIAEHLEPGTFKESGTNVATVIVIMDKA